MFIISVLPAPVHGDVEAEAAQREGNVAPVPAGSDDSDR